MTNKAIATAAQKTKPRFSQEYLKNILNYDTLTGIFTWKWRQDSPYAWNRKHLNKKAGRTRPCAKNRGNTIRINGFDYASSLLAWLYVYGKWSEKEIDHIDQNRTNNRIANLREASRLQNCRNRRKHCDNSSGYKGVNYDKRYNKWYAQIHVNKKSVWLGYHATSEDAANAYDKAAIKYFGEFASLNF